MTTPTRPTQEDLELYVMGDYDGDQAALEIALASDPAAAAFVAEEARFELLLREAASAATFCTGCKDLVRGDRCDACGAAIKPGGYTVERVLVSNAHGRMYVARDADGTRVALKELAFVHSPTLEVIAAFEREARFLRALEHPAIPRFVASFEEGSGVHVRYYLAQELVTGESLDARLADHWFSEAEIIEITRQVLGVLVYLQSVSPMVIHRDIKPANLLRRPDGTIAVVDFGAAHVQGATAGSTSIGTFGYMPIEQLAGEVDATTDPYALGASLLHLLSRREPWRILQGVSLEGINVSSALRGYLGKLVAPEPRDRFATAAVALEALERVARGEQVVATPRSGARSKRSWVRPLALAAASLVLVGTGIAGYSYEQQKAASHATSASSVGTLKIGLPPGLAGELVIDGRPVGSVVSGIELPILPGQRSVEVWQVTTPPRTGGHCAVGVTVTAGTVSTAEFGTLDCSDADVPPPERDQALPPGNPVDLSFKDAQLPAVLWSIGAQCALNVIVPDGISGLVTLELTKAPCDQALEALLESRGLWYRYEPQGRLVRILPRKEIEAAREAAVERSARGTRDDVLPSAGPVDFGFKEVPLRELLSLLGTHAGVNILLPDGINAKVTVQARGAPWDKTLQAILEVNGLWYRYRENGKILRVAPRKEIDHEIEAARARATQP